MSQLQVLVPSWLNIEFLSEDAPLHAASNELEVALSLSLSQSLSLSPSLHASLDPFPSSPLLSSPLLSSLNLFVCLSLSVQDITGKIWRRNEAKTEEQQQNERKLENWINYISLHWDVLNKLATLCKYKFVVSLKLDQLISPQIQFPTKKCVCLRKTSLLIYVNIRPSKFVCLFVLVSTTKN